MDLFDKQSDIITKLMESTNNGVSQRIFMRTICEVPADLFLMIEEDNDVDGFLAALEHRFHSDERRFTCMQDILYFAQHALAARGGDEDEIFNLVLDLNRKFDGHYTWQSDY